MGARMSSTVTRQYVSVPVPRREMTLTRDNSTADLVAEKVSALTDEARESARRGAAPFIDFEGVACGASGAEVAIRHGLGGRVRWWVVEWETNSTSNFALRKSTAKDATDSVLYLQSYVTGTATIRVEKVLG